MRGLLVVLVLLAGCGGDDAATAPAKGWVCGYGEYGDEGMCHRTAASCAAHGWKDCRPQPGAAACYSYTRRLERTTTTLCLPSFAACEDDRKPFLRLPDFEAVTPCERVE